MKRIIAIALSLSLVLTACGTSEMTGSNTTSSQTIETTDNIAPSTEEITTSNDKTDTPTEATSEAIQLVEEPESINFGGLNDPALLTYVENSVYENLIAEFDSDDYFVEKVDAIYLSEEYIEELAYNSKSNVFFGFTLADLEAEFQGTRYVFT